MQHIYKLIAMLVNKIRRGVTWLYLSQDVPYYASRNIKLYSKNLGSERESRLLAQGTIFAHEKLKPFLSPKGDIHVRLVDPVIKRAYIFGLYENVVLPFSFKITGKNIVIPRRYDEIFSTKFYVEVSYVSTGGGFRKRGAVGGDAWGEEGKLSLFDPGSTINIYCRFYGRKNY